MKVHEHSFNSISIIRKYENVLYELGKLSGEYPISNF